MTSVTNPMMYNLEFFNNMTFNGFDYKVPNEAVNIISELALEVGAPNYVKTPVFQKRDTRTNGLKEQTAAAGPAPVFKKRRGNRNMEATDEDWDTGKTFQPTVIEKKTGIAAQIDTIRTYLNKLTDKNYGDYKSKVLDSISELQANGTSLEEMAQVSKVLFDIASTNRFYSKIYADLYAAIITEYESMREPFDLCLAQFSELFEVIEYVDSSVDYDAFCRINKNNEKRKALSAFFVNLSNANIIPSERIVAILRSLVNTISNYIVLEDKKNQVDEIAENVAILYTPEFAKLDADEKLVYERIDGETITSVIESIAHSNVKTFPSLTKKTIFKFMDLVDM
jgi:hypothetical protein